MKHSLSIKEIFCGFNHIDVATTLTKLSESHIEDDDFENGEVALEKLLSIQQVLFGDEQLDIANTTHHLALISHARGKYVRAEQLYKLALSAMTKCLGAQHAKVRKLLADYAELLESLHRTEEAVHLLACAHRK